MSPVQWIVMAPQGLAIVSMGFIDLLLRRRGAMGPMAHLKTHGSNLVRHMWLTGGGCRCGCDVVLLCNAC